MDALRALAESNFEGRENYVAAQDVAGGVADEKPICQGFQAGSHQSNPR